jgi:L-ascorbate metabolism protein UlaG (beta-lactamase superfamily)
MRTSTLICSIVIFGLIIFMPGRAIAEEPNSGPTKAGLPAQEKEKAMSVKLQWFGHASFRITDGNAVVYIDPWKLKEAKHDATIVLVSHSHFDHYSASDIAKVSDSNSKLIGAGDVITAEGKGEVLKPGQTLDVGTVKVTGVPAYNPAKKFHPKSNNWLGFVVEIGGKKIYYAGDTDETPEMDALKNIDLALLPAGGTYTMDAEEAANATKQFKPKKAIPYHWGDIIGSQSDAEVFSKKAGCPVTILKPGDITSVE